MYTHKEPEARILALAGRQAGVVSQQQLNRIGFPRGALRRWRRGWARLATGIHCLDEPTWESWCWGGLLSADDGVIGEATAGHLHGFIVEPPSQITVWHTHKGSLRGFGDAGVSVRFRRGERGGTGTPARTRVEQTLLDLCPEATDDELVMAVTRAVAGGHTLPRRVLAAMEQRQRLPRRRLVKAVLHEAEAGVQSVLEWRFLGLLRAHGIPAPLLQQVLESGTRSDGVWEDLGLVVELDGRLGHEGSAFRDMDRDNRLALGGLITLRYGWHDILSRPCEVALQIHAARVARGDVGPGPECPDCSERRAA